LQFRILTFLRDIFRVWNTVWEIFVHHESPKECWHQVFFYYVCFGSCGCSNILFHQTNISFSYLSLVLLLMVKPGLILERLVCAQQLFVNRYWNTFSAAQGESERKCCYHETRVLANTTCVIFLSKLIVFRSDRVVLFSLQEFVTGKSCLLKDDIIIK
jgi:hypothetical protein